MKKPFVVNIQTQAIVMAEDADHAEDEARSRLRDIISDADPDVEALGVAASEQDLIEAGWNGECIPYNGDGDTRLKDIIAAPTQDPAP